MKMWWSGLMMGILFSSCRKSNYINESKTGMPEPPTDRWIIRHPQLPVLSLCINSYSEFCNSFGGNVIPIQAVILENGSRIPVGGSIRSITYMAVDTQEDYSLFRSKLIIIYNVYGYMQSSFQDVWTLGCVYENAGIPPFTNIAWHKRVYEINSSFSFSIPTLGIQVSKIKYLVVE